MVGVATASALTVWTTLVQTGAVGFPPPPPEDDVQLGKVRLPAGSTCMVRSPLQTTVPPPPPTLTVCCALPAIGTKSVAPRHKAAQRRMRSSERFIYEAPR